MEELSEVKDKKSPSFTLLALIPFLLIFLGIFAYLYFKYPTTSPLTALSYFYYAKTSPHAGLNKQVIAFLPYWRMDDTKYTRFDLLSEIIFFSLSADENGQIVKVSGQETAPGWRWWNSRVVKDLIAKAQISGGKFSLTLDVQKNSHIRSILDSKNAQDNLINALTGEVASRHLDGINIDFEYIGDPGDEYRQKFVDFSRQLSAALHEKQPQIELSLDLLPTQGRDKSLFDLGGLNSVYDRFIVMSYDYYGSNSETAGPIAPMNGFAKEKYFFDVATTYQDYLKYLPKEKLIMGVPYYGWDWPVEDGAKPLSKTLEPNDANGYAAVMSYGRMRENPDLKPTQCQWEALAQETWCWYKDQQTQKDHQVWFEDNRSIAAKFDFSRDQKLSGIAIWTLGYDKGYPDLWNLISDKFTVKK